MTRSRRCICIDWSGGSLRGGAPAAAECPDLLRCTAHAAPPTAAATANSTSTAHSGGCAWLRAPAASAVSGAGCWESDPEAAAAPASAAAADRRPANAAAARNTPVLEACSPQILVNSALQAGVRERGAVFQWEGSLCGLATQCGGGTDHHRCTSPSSAKPHWRAAASPHNSTPPILPRTHSLPAASGSISIRPASVGSSAQWPPTVPSSPMHPAVQAPAASARLQPWLLTSTMSAETHSRSKLSSRWSNTPASSGCACGTGGSCGGGAAPAAGRASLRAARKLAR